MESSGLEEKGPKVEDYISQYTDVFTGEGKLEGLLHLEIDKNVQPVQLPTRKVPIALKEPLKQELDRLSNIGVIWKVATPTNWISALVVTTKKNGKVRLYIDPKPSNEALHRNHYPLPTIDDVVPLLSKARVFTVLDAKNGFWHDPSSFATTVLCKSNESVIRRNSWISGLFDEKWRSFVHLESLKKIQRIFPVPVVLVDANFRAVIRVYW